MRYQLASALLTATALIAPASGQEKFDAAARLKPISKYINDNTVLVGHVDLSRLDMGAMLSAFRKYVPARVPEEGAQVVQALERAEVMRKQLVQAGLAHWYLVGTISDKMGPEVLMLVVPFTEASQVEPIQGAIKLFWNEPPIVDTGAVVVGTRGVTDLVPGLKPQPRPDFEVPFATAGDTALQIGVVPGKAAKLHAKAQLRDEADDLGGPSPFAILRAALKWGALTVNLPPKPALALTVEMEDAESAEKIRDYVSARLRDTAAGLNLRDKLPELDKLLEILTPAQKDNRLRVVLSEKNGALDLAAKVGAQLPLLQGAASGAAKRTASINNLKQIILAMHNHHDTRRTLPPQASQSKEGQKLLSWRVALLPFLEEITLYNEFHRDEPWDSEHNKKLIERMPKVFASPLAPPELAAEGKTVYVAPIGKGTVFGGEKGVGLRQISNGTSNTVVVVEAAPESAVIWTKPDDWTFDEKDPHHGLFNEQRKEAAAAFADGHVEILPAALVPEGLLKMFRMNDGD